MNLTEFLLARIADREAMAEQAKVAESTWDLGDDGVCDEQGGHVGLSPARVLAECEAKRRIVELHQPIWASDIEWADCAICPSALASGGWPCPTLRFLALPYAGHPDYREEWKP